MTSAIFRPQSVFGLIAVAAIATVILVACSGTRLAYDTAETLEAKAFVISEHYAALLREANELADAGAPREHVELMQLAERRATPVVLELRRAVNAYNAVRNAENEAALQEALAEAALVVSDFINAVRGR